MSAAIEMSTSLSARRLPLQRYLISRALGYGLAMLAMFAARAFALDAAPALVAVQAATSTAPDLRAKRALIEPVLQQARAAIAANHFAAPPGDNALELYLKVLDIDAGSRAAQDAILDLFMPAVYQTDATIAAGRYQDAERMLVLLERARPGSATTIELRRKLRAPRAAPAARVSAAYERGAFGDSAAQRTPVAS